MLTGDPKRFYTGEPVFKFGEGLSFTSFETGVATAADTVTTLSAAALDTAIEATRHRPHTAPAVHAVEVSVVNTGARAGAETVLGFVSPPGAGTDGQPLRSLRRYEKVHLAPGTSTTVSLRFTAHDFGAADRGGVLRAVQGEWVVGIGDSGARQIVRVGP